MNKGTQFYFDFIRTFDKTSVCKLAPIVVVMLLEALTFEA